MAVSFVGIGSQHVVVGGSGGLTPGDPTGLATDDIKYLVYFARGTAADPADPSGWTEIVNNGGTNGRRLVVWRRLHAGDAAPTVANPDAQAGDVNVVVMVAFRGENTTTPENDTGLANQTGQVNIVCDAGTGDLTVPAGGAVLVFGHKGSNSGTGADVLTGDGLTWVEDLDGATALGNTMRWAIQHALAASAVTVTDKTIVVAGTPTASDGAGGMIAIAPAAAGDPTETGDVSLTVAHSGVEELVLLQKLRPVSTVAANDWRTQAAGTDLHTAIDEATPNDADYIVSPQAPVNEDCEVAHFVLAEPIELGTIKVRVRRAKDAAGGTMDGTYIVKQGATTIATIADNNVSNTPATLEHTLTGPEEAAIVYDASGAATLSILFRANQSA